MSNELFRIFDTNPKPHRAKGTTLSVYWEICRQIAQHLSSPLLYVMARMAWVRLMYGRGAEAYEGRRLHEHSLSALKDFISVEERDAYHRRLNPESGRVTSEDKLAFEIACGQRNVPTVKNHGLILLGHSYDGNTGAVPVVRTENELRQLLLKLPDATYIMKPLDTAHGWGVTAVEKSGETLCTANGSPLGPAQIMAACQHQPFTRSGFLIQERLTPHRDLRKIMPGPGLGAFRCISLIAPSGEVEIPWIALKIPGKGCITDNFSRGITGTVATLVDISTGRIVTSIGRTAKRPITGTVEHHPETGEPILGFQIPLWSDLLKTITHAARAFSACPSIGWDIAITDRGPVILEMNWYWGHDLIEVASNRGLRPDLVNLFEKYLILYAKNAPENVR